MTLISRNAFQVFLMMLYVGRSNRARQTMVSGEPAPPNNYCSGAIPVEIGEPVNGLLGDSVTYSNAPKCGWQADGVDLWYSVEGTGHNLIASAFDWDETSTWIEISVYTGLCNDLTCVGATFYTYPGNWWMALPTFEWSTFEGVTYYVRVACRYLSCYRPFELRFYESHRCGTSYLSPDAECCDPATNSVGSDCCGTVGYDSHLEVCCPGNRLYPKYSGCPETCIKPEYACAHHESGAAEFGFYSICYAHHSGTDDLHYHQKCERASKIQTLGVGAPLSDNGDKILAACGCCKDHPSIGPDITSQNIEVKGDGLDPGYCKDDELICNPKLGDEWSVCDANKSGKVREIHICLTIPEGGKTHCQDPWEDPGEPYYCGECLK